MTVFPIREREYCQGSRLVKYLFIRNFRVMVLTGETPSLREPLRQMQALSSPEKFPMRGKMASLLNGLSKYGLHLQLLEGLKSAEWPSPLLGKP